MSRALLDTLRDFLGGLWVPPKGQGLVGEAGQFDCLTSRCEEGSFRCLQLCLALGADEDLIVGHESPSLDANRTLAALQVSPGRFGDEFVFTVFARGHAFAHGFVVHALGLELRGNRILVWHDLGPDRGQVVSVSDFFGASPSVVMP
ncbi:hypothetical protein D3C78_1404970 [compost metagenome]